MANDPFDYKPVKSHCESRPCVPPCWCGVNHSEWTNVKPAMNPDAKPLTTPAPDLGAIRDFPTGATRSSDVNKFDYEGFFHPDVLHYRAAYMHAHRVQRDGTRRDSDNWQRGIPATQYVKSLLRHTVDLWRAWRGTVTYDPDTGAAQSLGTLCAAILFNVEGLLLELIRTDDTHKFIRPSHRTSKADTTEKQPGAGAAVLVPSHLYDPRIPR